MIVGTAGHIDHGKTALVRALTGVDTDRLPEEQRRGITIELGFAPLVLDDDLHASVVDVPGHEAFVRTMLAGASGIDLALLVVAADEGVMPQTREHLAILSLLGVRGGVVALTKSDLVDADWIALVEDDVRATVTGGPLAAAEIIAVSARSGAGVPEVRRALAAAARSSGPRDAFAHLRLPVDRAFSVRGTGTVVTGTVWSGSIARDSTVTAFPGGARLRVRGVQQHGEAVTAAESGARAAIALAGVEVADVPRGAVLVDGDGWQETRVLRATVQLLGDAAAIGPRSRVRLHLGTADVGARVVSRGGALGPGEVRGARVVLDHPIVARGGDRFVLRAATPAVTVGGGVVTDPHPPHRRARPWPAELTDRRDVLAEMLSEAGGAGIAASSLPVRLGLTPADVRDATGALGDGAVRVGDRLFAGAAVEQAVATVVAAVVAHHAEHPLEPGLSRQHARSQLAVTAALAEHAVSLAVRRGAVEADGATLRLPGWREVLTDQQRSLSEALTRALAEAGREPPSVGELAARLGASVAEMTSLMRLAERTGRVVAVEADRYFDVGRLAECEAALRAGMVGSHVHTPAELRDMLGVSRKFLIPLLEHFDRVGVTRRAAEGRVLAGT